MAENTNIEGLNEETQTEQVKTYSQEEVDALLQSEVDRRITGALKKQEERFKKQQSEAEKLAKMNEQDKYEYQLQQREAEIAEREKQLALLENKNEASKILSEKGLSLDLVDFVVAEDAEAMSFNINKLDRAFKASVKAEVEKRLGSNSPKKNFVEADAITKEQLLNMPINKLQEMLNANPDL